MKMQTDTEHQQDDPDLRQLFGEMLVRIKARRKGADSDSRQQITDHGRQANFLRDKAHQQGCCQSAGDGQNKVKIMHSGLIVF